MVAPGGWRVVPIVVVRGGRELRRFQLTRHGVYVCECTSPPLALKDELEAGRVAGEARTPPPPAG